MKKQTIWGVVFAMLSTLSLAVASNPTAVSVFAVSESTTKVYSFFQPVPDAPAAMCLLYAGIASGITLMLSVAYLFRGKKSWLKWIVGGSFVSMTLAVLPLVIKSEPIVLPNMLHPLTMGVVSMLSYFLLRSDKTAAEEPEGERLSLH